MCGIVGYAGREQAAPILLDGLQRLEYRGYDSAGTAVCSGEHLQVRKAAGRLEQLARLLERQPVAGVTGIGHTRWATHGSPADHNAHPHLDCTGRVAVVHNGIIENYLTLREELEARGHVFFSDTDTEVLPHLIEENYRGDLLEAVRVSLKRLKGSWAVAVLHADEPGRVVAARKDSPLVVGIGRGANFAASDIPAILPYTRSVHVLDDDELAAITADDVTIIDGDGRPREKRVLHVDWDAAAAEKGGYEHFMRKEIHEQPRAVRDTLAGKLDREQARIVLPGVTLDAGYVRDLRKVDVLAMGTARHAGLVGKTILEQVAKVPVEVDLAAEYRYREPLVDEGTMALMISQSGETADTLAAMREARARGARVLAITNVVGSSLAREADHVIYTVAGPEVAVASTKAYTTQLVALYLLAGYLGLARGTADTAQVAELMDDLAALPAQLEAVLELEDQVAALAHRFAAGEHVFFIGRGLDAATALEGALKLKEISYIHAEAYAAGELKHGTLALITDGVPVVALATQRALLDKMLSNIKEVKARGASVLAITVPEAEDVARVADATLFLPPAKDLLMPVVSVLPLQMLAYHVARLRGCDVDKPRNLAKSVTVE